ncbi:AarF/ABC1/UbiB kinase family protein [Rhodobacter sp. KR11]|uniref:ABC1 kinase family protein n=1 Tax=Rhodobacter sp. KR11 TaxID=2974588 RepID=UPI002223A315|nr:AarF/ABC1/UbiB kinase family protein [Rhodobacter sp. KR11]MCW1920223.1 AarF/ABC1/UbiB kinase family protein [Rhodobacter sp. KR11]
MAKPGDRSRSVPQARLARLAAFGQLATGVAGGVLGEGLRRLAKGERPQLSDLLLTPANALRVTEQLSRLRGAAMKLGQMLSLDAGDLLPAELTAILARLRDDGHVMPAGQLQKVLSTAWGPDWRQNFTSFDMVPIAAASIGQVHRARLKDGRDLAVKVQYPGVRASIDADIDNVATLLRMSGLLPAGLDIAPLLAEAKRQLHEEADYLREAAMMRRYGALLAGDDRFIVPQPHDALVTRDVLPMDFILGGPIESLATAPGRQKALESLLDLVLAELFDFGLMQTDPNFANYRWQAGTGRIVLLDFGAAREVAPGVAAGYRGLMAAGLDRDPAAIKAALLAMGFASPALLARHGATIDRMIAVLLAHIAASPALFAFADRSFVARLRTEATGIGADRAAWVLPPAETLFVQRKISGMALLCVRMGAELPLLQMLQRHRTGMVDGSASHP